MEKECTRCKITKPLTDYCKKSNGVLGVQPACKTCMNIAYTISRNKNLDHYKAVKMQRVHDIAARFQGWKAKKGCKHCSEKDPVCLDLHHLDPSIKDTEVSNLMGYSWKVLMKESKKCIVVCANCHRKIHAKINKSIAD